MSSPVVDQHAADIELLRRVSAGDETALASLYDRHRGILFGLLLRILKRRGEAEDVLQEVFIQVWQRAGDFDPARGRPFTWLVTIARSRAIDRLRTLDARERLATEAASTTPTSSDALADASHAEERDRVRRALDLLPSDQNQAVCLAYFDGLTQTEIARRLDVPLGTVKTRVRSALSKLRESLGNF